MNSANNKSGFEAPQDYFDGFEDRLMLRIMEEKLPKRAGFVVPDAYFDSVENRVIERIASETPPRVIPIFGRKALVYALASAACLLLIFSLFNALGGPESTSLEDVPLTSIEQYINEGGLDIDSYDVLALMDEAAIEDLTMDTELFTEETLEEYLFENADDTSLLINQQ
jgi:hypothetical protein